MNNKVNQTLRKYFNSYPKMKVSKGKILSSPGETTKSLFFLNEGIVRSYTINKNGEETTLLLFKSPSFFPSIPLILNKTNNYYFQAVTNCIVFKSPIYDTKKFIDKHPEVLLDLTSRILKGIEGIFFQIELMHNGNAYQKLVNLLKVSKDRFGRTSAQTVIIPFTHQLIGSIIGSKRETVSRQLKKLRDKKIIELMPGKIIITNLSQLEKEVVDFT